MTPRRRRRRLLRDRQRQHGRGHPPGVDRARPRRARLRAGGVRRRRRPARLRGGPPARHPHPVARSPRRRAVGLGHGPGAGDLARRGRRRRASCSTELARRLEPSTSSRCSTRGREACARPRGWPADAARVQRRVDLRYRGTDTALTVDRSAPAILASAFRAEHERLFGYARPGHAIEITALRVELVAGSRAAGARPPPARPPRPPRRRPGPGRCRRRRSHHLSTAAAGRGAGLPPRGPAPAAPAWPARRWSSTPPAPSCLDPGFTLEVGRPACSSSAGDRDGPQPDSPALAGQATDPRAPTRSRLEIFGNLLHVDRHARWARSLQRTALSTNIRERLDFSCAVFDAQGGLVANAPHIPVHLGAMGESIRAVLARPPRSGARHGLRHQRPGRRRLAPARHHRGHAGARRAGQRLFFTASRGHHADVGGITPGLDAARCPHSLTEEGVVLARPAHRRRRPLRRPRRARAPSPPAPTRRAARSTTSPTSQAQIAANRAGARLLGELVAARGRAEVLAYMRPRAGQRRRPGRRRDRSPARRRPRLRRRPRRRHRHRRAPASPWRSHRASTSPAPARSSSPATSTRPARSPSPRCSTSCAAWSPRRSRSTAAACARSPSTSRPARSSRPTPSAPSPAATSRPRSGWSTSCSAPWAWPPPARAP